MGGLIVVRHAEVGQAWGAIFGQQHIGGLDVAVDNIEVVGAGQGIGQFQGDLQDLLNVKLPSFFEQVFQVTAFYVFHHQIVLVMQLESIQ